MLMGVKRMITRNIKIIAMRDRQLTTTTFKTEATILSSFFKNSIVPAS